MIRLLGALCCALLLSLPLHVAAEVNLESLLRDLKFTQVKISPDGNKLAVASQENGKRVVALMTLDPLEITYVLRFVGRQEVGTFEWVNNERIVTSVVVREGWLDSPLISGDLYAVNYDGRRRETIFGFIRGSSQDSFSRIKKKESQEAHARIISTLDGDDKHVLVSTTPWTRGGGIYYQVTGEEYGEVLKLNVYNGRTKKLMTLPSRGGRAFADRQGKVHFAYGVVSDGVFEFFQRRDDKWLRLGDPEYDAYAYPVAYSDDGKTAYLLSQIESDTLQLVSYDLASGQTTRLFADDRVDITNVTHYPGTEAPMAVHLDDGKPSAHYLDKTHAATRLMRGIQKAFDGYNVQLGSTSRDGTIGIVTVDGDNLPADYFHVDFSSRSVDMLMSSARWLEPDQLLTTDAFDMQARDGQALQGYLTFPRGERKQLPMIVLPHGGPQARDYWEYDRERQILAAAGYLVLNVNFRGSDGYGQRFQNASHQHWGSVVQNDIADATRWAIEQGYADPKRVCIYGASFGAYSAMMGVIREPELYRCAAGFAGVYDLAMMYQRGDIRLRRSGVAYLKEALGRDETQLEEFSPVANADKIKVPVYLAHGGEDQRAPIEHAQALEQALRAANVDVTTQYYAKGGHGYFTQQANMALYSGLLEFFAAHIGGD